MTLTRFGLVASDKCQLRIETNINKARDKSARPRPPMPKRKREDSESCCSLPLTRKNLNRLQEALRPSLVTMPRTPSPRRASSTLDAREKLTRFRIHVDTDEALPPELDRHIHDVVLKPRNEGELPSPNAKKVAARRKYAAQQNETTGVQQIVAYLLFSGEAEMDDRVEAVPYIARKAELLLNRFFLPPAPDTITKETWKELSQPKPDTSIGYILRSDAAAAHCEAPFSASEERILDTYVLTKHLHFPFLTAQWKTPNGSEGLYCAQSQAARDGAVVVNHLHDLYTVAYPDPPSLVDTCHFSLVADLQYGEIWVHWRQGMDHYMKQVCYFAFRDVATVEKARGYLRNIKDYALNERLPSIRNALGPFATNRSAGRYPSVPAPASEVSATVSELSQSSSATFRLQAPPTPLSVASEPVKKRARLDSDGEVGD